MSAGASYLLLKDNGFGYCEIHEGLKPMEDMWYCLLDYTYFSPLGWMFQALIIAIIIYMFSNARKSGVFKIILGGYTVFLAGVSYYGVMEHSRIAELIARLQ